MPITVPNNYYITSCEAKLYYNIYTDSKFLVRPAIGDNGDNINFPLYGVTNFTLKFDVISKEFRGIGDCSQIRKPVSWDASIEFTRYITSADDYIFNYSTLGTTATSGGFHYINMQNNNLIGIKLVLPTASGTRSNKIWGVFAIENASMSGEQEQYSETIRAVAYNKWGLESAFVSGT